MIKLSEVKINIATAIAAAFGFVIALLWRDVIIGILKYTGYWQEGGFDSSEAIIAGVILVIVITIICVFGIMFISKWGGIEKK
jgi:uncharacterized protein YacL